MTKRLNQKAYKMNSIEKDFIEFIMALDNDIIFRTPKTLYFKEDFINADLSEHSDIIELTRILSIITISYITQQKIVTDQIKKIKLMNYIHLKKDIEVIFSAIWKDDLYSFKLYDNHSFKSLFNMCVDEFFNKLLGIEINGKDNSTTFLNKKYLENRLLIKSDFFKQFQYLIDDYYSDDVYVAAIPNYFCMNIKNDKFNIDYNHKKEVLSNEKLRTLCKMFRSLFNEDVKTYQLLKLKIEPKKLKDTSYLFESTADNEATLETNVTISKFLDILNTKIGSRYERVTEIDGIFKKVIDSNLQNENSNYILKELPTSPKVLLNQNYYPLYFKIPQLKVKDDFIRDVKALVHSYPHFKEVIEYIALELTFRLKKDDYFSLSPIMILGDYGIGKNSFINSLNNILGMYGNIVNFASLHTSFEITGLASAYEGAIPGIVSNVILKNNISNPLLILDEFDKNERYGGSNMYAPFYDLLEKQGRENFFENYFATYFNLSNLSIIALVNDLSTVPKGIRERFVIFTVNNPNQEMLNPIVKSIYSKIVKNNKIYEDIELTELELQHISNIFKKNMETNPRKIRKHIENVLLGKFKIKNTWNI